MAARFKFKNIDSVRDNIRTIARNYHDKIARAQVAEMKIELAEVIKRTPELTGALKKSEHLEGPTWKWQTVMTSIVAGGSSAPYAPIVHEDLEAFHPKGQAKFIESVLLESRPHMGERIARRAKLDRSDF